MPSESDVRPFVVPFSAITLVPESSDDRKPATADNFGNYRIFSAAFAAKSMIRAGNNPT